MFKGFPKTRTPLSGPLREIYKAHYKENREGSTPASWSVKRMESWLHKTVAEDVEGSPTPRSTLEIGAGNLNHLAYEAETSPYDVVEPAEWLYEKSPHLGRIREVYAEIYEIPLGPAYDRILSVATFEHLCDLPWVIAHAALLLNPGGALRVSIPSEGEILWGLGWRLTTGIEFRLRYGLDYGELRRYEHVNTSREIEALLRYFFRDVNRRIFGINRSWSFYQSFVCTHPHELRCKDALQESSSPG